MEENGSQVNPWANGESNPVHVQQPKRLGGDRTNLSSRVGEKFEKSKAMASTGMKKVKEGATVGVKWIKVKYQTSKLAQKK